MLRKIRITLATLFFGLITLLFLDFTGTLQHYFSWMTKIQLLPAVLALNVVIIIALIVLTLIFGRVYCSVICPLGVFQDIMSHLRRKKNRFSHSRALTWLRVSVLAAFVVLLVIPSTAYLARFIAPYSAFGRMAANLFAPVYKLGNNALAYLAERMDSYAFYSVDVWHGNQSVLIIAAVTFVVIAALAWIGGRTWCNSICPVGTVLGFLSKFSILKIRIDADKCNKCGLCARNCKASCIDFEAHKVDYSRCVTCGNCIGKCHKDAIHYGLRGAVAPVEKKQATPVQAETEKSDKNTTRREFLTVGALMTASAAIKAQEKTTDGGLAIIEDKKVPDRATPLTPPGSLSARNLANHCTACQLCISACPNHVLQPSTDLTKLMQPEMSYQLGFCRPECTRCSDVCPTGAIRPIGRAKKASIKIGTAIWILDNCIVKRDGVQCGNCARHCPNGAIEMVAVDPNDEKSPKFPSVNTERCIGCGACEYVCPARPFSAIYVEGAENHREV